MEASPQLPHPLDSAAERELELLQEIRDGIGSDTVTMALTDESVLPVLNSAFPVEGMSRLVVPRKATGGIFDVPSASEPTKILAANSERYAGSLVNMGQADCLLILTPEGVGARGGFGTLFLTAHGGSWDFRLGPPLWCGSISAMAVETISGVEVFTSTELAVVEV